jgi:hypothetical protein
VTPEKSQAQQNYDTGKAREDVTDKELKDENADKPNTSVQRERMLRDKDGKKVVDPVTGEGRRVDHAVIDRDKGTAETHETTGPNVDKTDQLDKEKRIRAAGGTYIRDKETRKMVPVNDVSKVKRQQ